MNEIEVNVAELEQFFDHMDASPLATRNLDPRAVEVAVEVEQQCPRTRPRAPESVGRKPMLATPWCEAPAASTRTI